MATPKPSFDSKQQKAVINGKSCRVFELRWIGIGLLILSLFVQSFLMLTPAAQAQTLPSLAAKTSRNLVNSATPTTPVNPTNLAKPSLPLSNTNAISAWQYDQTHPRTIQSILQPKDTKFTSNADLLRADKFASDSTQANAVTPAVKSNVTINPSEVIYANKFTDDAVNLAPPASCYQNPDNTDCSLRSAIKIAQADTNRSASRPDFIILQPLSNNQYSISNTPLPQIPDNVYLTADPNLNCVASKNLALINGSSLPSGDGLTLGNNDYLIDVAIELFSGHGLVINGSNNIVTCAVIAGNKGFGINITPGASNNQIGGQFGNGSDNILPTASGKILGYGGLEVVVAQNALGIAIGGSSTMSTTNNIIRNTAIGYVPFFGNQDTGNQNDGIFVYGGASNNIIGSNLMTQTNVISGNHYDGISFYDSTTSNNQIIGNFIGTDITGTTAISNQHDGVAIQYGASNNILQGNVISGNYFSGIAISGPSNNNVIQGNIIGVKADKSAALPNGIGGPGQNGTATGATVCNPGRTSGNISDRLSEDCNAIFVYGDPNNPNNSPSGTVIGGNRNAGQGNILAAKPYNFYQLGTSFSYVYQYDSGVLLDYSDNNVVQGNSFGAALINSTPISYGGAIGVRLVNGSSNNQIGGDSSLGLGNFFGYLDSSELEIDAYNFSYTAPAPRLSIGNKIQGNSLNVDWIGNSITTKTSNATGILLYSSGLLTSTVDSTLIGVDYTAANPNSNLANLIGNCNSGVYIYLSAAEMDNEVNGNKFGFNADLTSANASIYNDDIYLYNATNTKIQNNYFGGNATPKTTQLALFVSGSITDTLITKNYIGTNPAGNSFPLNFGISANAAYHTVVTQNIIASNLNDAIVLDYGTQSSLITQNIIKNNGGYGIYFYDYNTGIPADSATIQNTISQNSIYDNGGLGIDLNYLTANPQGVSGGADVGANNQAQAPTINSASLGLNSGLQASGTASPNSKVEIFLADNTTITQGKTYLGTVAADSNGKFNLNQPLPNTVTGLPNSAYLVATDTLNDPAFPNRVGSTSQFSQPFAATLVPSLSLSPTTLNFSANVGSNPAGQAALLSVINGSASYTTSIAYSANSGGANWLQLSPSSGSVTPGNPTPVSINVNTGNLAAGTYTATVTFQDSVNTADKATLNVTLTVIGTTPTPTPTTNGYTYSLPLVANNADTTIGHTTTFVTFQNLSNTTANVTVQYYDLVSGNSGPSNQLTIPAHGQKAILPNIASGASNDGIVTSDQPLNLVVSEALNGGGSAYSVSAATAATLYSPLALNGQYGFNTDIVVFNAGGTSNATGKILFFDENGNPAGTAQSFNIPAHASQTFKQSDPASGLTSNHAYWAKIVADSSTASLTAQVIEFGPNNFVATFNALVPSQLATTLYAPATFNGQFNFVTGMAIANPSNSAASVTINYYDKNGTNLLSQPLHITANGVAGIFQPGVTNLPNTVTSAVISSNQPLIMTVNERGPGAVSGTYVGLSNPSTNVALPVAANGFAGFITGATVFNTGSSAAHLTFTYLNGDGTTIGSTQTVTLAPNASFLVYQGDSAQGLPGPNSANPFFGTALLSSDQPLLVTTNALNTSNGLFYTYTEPSN